MSEPDIERLKQTILFKRLYEKEKLLKDHEISEEILSVVREISPLLERIPENLPEFTLHDANHSARVVELMDKIMPSDTLKHLNIIELSILIYAAYLHDVGMTASKEEREEIIKNDPEFTKVLISNEELSFKLDEAKKNGELHTAKFIEDKFFTEFLRKKHVERSHKLIKEMYGSEKTPISWKGVPYYRLVQNVCDSHGLPLRDLYDIKKWRRDALVRDKNVNVQYLSVILRLADILDMDQERTPKCLLDFINPHDGTSIKEWKKHLSIVGCKISKDDIIIEAECEHPVYERALREFIDMIETERLESFILTSHYKDPLASIYRLDLSKPMTKEYIKSNGEYIYSDFHFKLDFHRVIDLLMGERLYGVPYLALREILQNSVDAVRYRQSMEMTEGNLYSPCIKITLKTDDILKTDDLIIEDNGVGMDEDIFGNYFLQIGRSYYSSPECRIHGIEIDPVSEFGIGILSVFMVASKFTVESRRKPLDPLHPPAPINVEIPTAYDYFVRRPSLRSEIGTKLTLTLKPNHPFSSSSLIELIPKIAPFIEYPIAIETSDAKKTYKPLSPREKDDEIDCVKKYFNVLFDNNEEGIDGKISIVKTKERYQDLSRFISFAQRGFKIPIPEDYETRGIFGNCIGALNFSGDSRLSLSPSRSEIVKDKNYKRVFNIIRYRILDELKNYLDNIKKSVSYNEYINIVNELLQCQLLYKQVSPNIWRGVEPKDQNLVYLEYIFENYIPLLIISDEGQRIYKTIKDVNTNSIAFTSINDWPDEISDVSILNGAKRLFGSNTVLIMNEETGQDERDFLLQYILGEFNNIYITSIPGVIIKKFNTGEISHNNSSIDDPINLNYNLSSEIGKPPLFTYIDNNLSTVYNAHHPLIAKLLDGKKAKNEAASKALQILETNIDRCLNNLNEEVFSPLFRRALDLENSSNVNYMLIGILKYYPDLFQKLYKAVESYWDEAKNLGAISREEDFIGFSLDDLPWFWNYEISSLKKRHCKVFVC